MIAAALRFSLHLYCIVYFKVEIESDTTKKVASLYMHFNGMLVTDIHDQKDV